MANKKNKRRSRSYRFPVADYAVKKAQIKADMLTSNKKLRNMERKLQRVNYKVKYDQ